VTEAPPQPAAERLCEHCRLAIPDGARVCTHCNLHQGLRGKLGLSSTVLALLVALISVLAQAAPVMVDLFSRKTSLVTLSRPYLDGATMRFVATNRGKEPGLIETAQLNSETISSHIVVRFRDPQQALVQPGTQQVVLDLQPMLEWQAALRVAQSLADQGPAENVASAFLSVRESDGSLANHSFQIASSQFAYLLALHSARCRSVEAPTLENGCAGGRTAGAAGASRSGSTHPSRASFENNSSGE
jgi:hypothetical protein